MSIQWATPEWLLLLPLVPLVGWLIRGTGGTLSFPRGRALSREGAAVSRAVTHLPLVLRLACVTLLILALARPRTVAEVVEQPAPGVPIVIALDVSSSMLAQDFRPRDRLEVAKRTVARFVEGRQNDPIGLVAFAAEALTLVPITTVQPVLLNALRSLRVGLLEDGTAIGEGLATAVNRLRQVPAEDKVVILMSDGESNRGEIDPMDAARAAATYGVRVFTIGVGSEGVAPVPVQQRGSAIRYAELPVGIDEDLLRGIAETTGGRYFRATNPDALRRIYDQIDRLVRSSLEPRRIVRYAEWYLVLLAAAAVLLVAEWLVRGSRWGAIP